MSNKLYPKGATRLMTKQIDFAGDDIRAVLLPSTYVFDAAHEYLSDVAFVATAVALTGKTVVAGAFDADDTTFDAVAAGSTLAAVALYKHTGVANTSPLLYFVDELVGFPVATNGGGHKIIWSDGAYKILALV